MTTYWLLTTWWLDQDSLCFTVLDYPAFLVAIRSTHTSIFFWIIFLCIPFHKNNPALSPISRYSYSSQFDSGPDLSSFFIAFWRPRNINSSHQSITGINFTCWVIEYYWKRKQWIQMLEAVETLLTNWTDQWNKGFTILNPNIHYTCRRIIDTNAQCKKQLKLSQLKGHQQD